MNIITFLVGASIFVFGIYQILVLVRRKKKIDNSKDWPITSGTIDDTKVVYSSSGKGGKHYYAEIHYNYLALGLPYKGKIQKNSFWGAKDNALEEINFHPIGSSFSVRYNPRKNDEHVVDFDEITITDIFTAITILIFGIIFLIASTFPSW